MRPTQNKLVKHLQDYPFSILMIALPLAVAAESGHWGAIWVFVLSAVGVIPMAVYIILGFGFFLLPVVI